MSPLKEIDFVNEEIDDDFMKKFEEAKKKRKSADCIDIVCALISSLFIALFVYSVLIYPSDDIKGTYYIILALTGMAACLGCFKNEAFLASKLFKYNAEEIETRELVLENIEKVKEMKNIEKNFSVFEREASINAALKHFWIKYTYEDKNHNVKRRKFDFHMRNIGVKTNIARAQFDCQSRVLLLPYKDYPSLDIEEY